MQGYCVKCKDKREMNNPISVTLKKQPAMRGTCAVCEAKMVTFIPTRIEQDGKFYRLRRGVMVEIPAAWLGKTVFHETINHRKSKRGYGRFFKRKEQR